MWLGWIPKEVVRGEATLSFRMSVESLLRDLGPNLVKMILGLMVLVGAASVLHLHATRNLYLSLAVFHGYLELAALCSVAVAGTSASRRV